ncbi:hypothetical protein KAK06_13415 [Ideonella sp. 4Y11]|uniref:Uncharacterized protein n=1 Tax=Ideonella aquatica TaxID=2824119 RepID=A0A940YL24_9BURK|nr:hypothetical protein [Ideonella aquatica]MBQ0959946.1 hypothetical protein [Ideonella aquatica]
MAAALSACGGGGGGGSDTGTDPGGNVDQPQGSTPVTIDALASGAGVFHFKVGASLASDTGLKGAVGGSTYAAWNPASSSKLLSAGLKVTFFGKAGGCPGTRDGVVDAGEARDLGVAAAAASISSSASTLWRWAPSGQSTGCNSASKVLSGPSITYLNPTDSTGGLAMYTHAGPRSDGSSGLVNAYGAEGQDGKGSNAHIIGTFSAFRQAWNSSSAIKPWVGLKSTAQQASARVVATLGVGAADLGTDVTSQTIQAKQQISTSFINTQCMAEGYSAKRPCQLQYLFNTAIYRYGVSDWSSVGWFQEGGVWFDPMQGGVPVIDGPVKASGQTVVDASSGLALFSSKGDATQHGSFNGKTFDLRISFTQLQNVLRVISGRKAGVAPADVTDEQLVADWGTRWNDPSAWALLNSAIGQEIYNPESEQRAVSIGGNLKQLYVAPQS